MSDAKMNKKENQTEKPSAGHKALTIVGIVLCVILVPILIVNLTMIIKGLVNKEKVPTFGGYAPLIVLTDSMSPTINAGDLIVVKSVDASKVKEGDVISFFDPASSGTAVVTHRVLKQNKTAEDNLPAWHNVDNLPGIEGSGENIVFHTQGDFNNTADIDPVPASKLVGVWTGINLKGAGNVAMFLQSTPGLILCIGVPIVILVAYELIRRKLYERNKRQDTDDLLRELEALKQAQKTQEIGNVSVNDASEVISAEKTAAAQTENAQRTAETEAAKAQARADELQAQLAALQAQLAQAKQEAVETNNTAGSDNDGQGN